MRASTSSRAHSPWAQLSASAIIALTSSADMRLRDVGTLTEVAGGANAWIEETQNAAAIARFRSIMINKEVEGVSIVDLFVDRFMTPFVPPRSCCGGGWCDVKSFTACSRPSALEFASYS